MMNEKIIKALDIFKASLVAGAAASSILTLFFIVYSFLLFPLGIGDIGGGLFIFLFGTLAGLIILAPIFFIVGNFLKIFYREKYFNKLIVLSNVSCIYVLIFFLNNNKHTNNNVHELYSEPIAKVIYIALITFSVISGSIIFLKILKKVS